MIRHHTIQSKWTDEGHRAKISLPCEPWSQGEAQLSTAEQKVPVAWSEADVEALKDLSKPRPEPGADRPKDGSIKAINRWKTSEDEECLTTSLRKPVPFGA
jgi:hypothetical protein